MTAAPMKLDLDAAHTTYRAKDGERLPGCTTVLGVLAKPSLYKWYADMEREGILGLLRGWILTLHETLTVSDESPLQFLVNAVEASLPAYKNGKPQPFAEIKRDKAADVGTVTHARIEAWLKGTTLDPDGIPPDIYTQSVYGLDRFMEFWDHERLALLASERIMVSEVHRVGGTGDVFCTSPASRIYLDIKTNAFNSSWPYPEHIAQASAYAMFAEEEDQEAIDEVWLVRVGKEQSDRTQVVKLTKKQRKAGVQRFLGALMCYNSGKDLG